MIKTLGIAAAMFFGMTAAAHAVTTITPVNADCDTNFTDTSSLSVSGVTTGCSSDLDRTDATKVNHGAGDGDFYSLGIGGAALFVVDPIFTGPTLVVEVTNGGTNHQEAADVYGSTDGVTFVLIDQITNAGVSGPIGGTSVLTISTIYKYLLFVDVSKTVYAGSGTTDGFDIDAVKVTPVPVPGALALFATGIAGFGALRRRRAA